MTNAARKQRFGRHLSVCLAAVAASVYLQRMTDPQPGGAPAEGVAGPAERQPILNIPGVLVALIGLIVGIHAVRAMMLSQDQDVWLRLHFAFIPARFGMEGFPGGLAADLWSFVTYALIHGDWGHVAINGVWMAAFGTPLARRWGAGRFLLFSAVTAAAGAAAQLLLHPGEMVPMVGASAAVSGYMAAATRFFFIADPFHPEVAPWLRPALPLSVVLTDRRTLVFLGVWFGVNLVTGLVGVGAGPDGVIAWESHIGGFLAGLLLFAPFDRVGRDPAPPPATEAAGDGSGPDQGWR